MQKKLIFESFKDEIEEIEKRGNLLEREQYAFVRLAIIKGGRVTARKRVLEPDAASQKTGWMTKKSEEEYCSSGLTPTQSVLGVYIAKIILIIGSSFRVIKYVYL